MAHMRSRKLAVIFASIFLLFLIVAGIFYYRHNKKPLQYYYSTQVVGVELDNPRDLFWKGKKVPYAVEGTVKNITVSEISKIKNDSSIIFLSYFRQSGSDKKQVVPFVNFIGGQSNNCSDKILYTSPIYTTASFQEKYRGKRVKLTYSMPDKKDYQDYKAASLPVTPYNNTDWGSIDGKNRIAFGLVVCGKEQL